MPLETTLIYTTESLPILTTKTNWIKLGDLIEAVQSINDDKWNHKTGILATTFHKPAGEAKMYVRFGYVPKKFSNTPEEKFQDQWTYIQ